MPSLRALRLNEPLSKSESSCQALIARANSRRLLLCAEVSGFRGTTYARKYVTSLYE